MQKNNIDLNDITIYVSTGGSWQFNDYQIEMVGVNKIDEVTQEMLTENALWVVDYYTYDRVSVLQSIPIDELEPIIDITYCGVYVAKIFMGSQINECF